MLCFWLEIPFLGKFGPKYQTWQFRLEFGSYTKSNQQNSVAMFTSFAFDPKYSFWQIWFKNSKLFEVKFGTKPNSNMQNLVVMFIFCFWQQISFLSEVGSKNQKCQVNLKFEFAEFNGDVHFFHFWPKTFFLGKFGPKI